MTVFGVNRSYLLRWRWLVLKSAFLVFLTPFCALSYYNQPCGNDDFATANLTRKLGFIEANRHLFLTWSGRFFTNAVSTGLNPLTYGGLHHLGLPAVAMLLLKVIVVAWAVAQYFQ